MAYDEALAKRVRKALDGHPQVKEIRMFGGLCWTVRGNMACGVLGKELVVRLGPGGEAALREPHVKAFDAYPRVPKGIVSVLPQGYAGRGFARWVARGAAYAEGLPAKRAATR